MATVLIADDDPADRRLLRMAFERVGCRARIEEAADGRALAARLRGDDPPELILLDLNMPHMTDDVRRLLHRPGGSGPVVLVLSGSSAERDVRRSLAQGARAYMRKPDGLQGFESLAAAVDAFWLRTARLPPVFAPGDDKAGGGSRG